jgi:hypothetical protein
VIVWAAHGAEWALAEKVSFNGVTKRITVNAGVTALDIREDVYSAWVRWVEREDNARFRLAMRVSGFDPIPGGFTGATYFMTNGWKLEYDPNVVAIAGVLYSDDYATPYWSATDQPIFPATVSSLVNSAVVTQNVVTGTALTQAQTADAVWQAAARTLTASLDPTKEQIAAQVRIALADELTRILEIAALHGLVLGSPLTVTTTERTAGSIAQSITSEAGGGTTVTRTA